MLQVTLELPAFKFMVVSLLSFQALPYVCLLIAMLFFIYAIIGMQVREGASGLWWGTVVAQVVSGFLA